MEEDHQPEERVPLLTLEEILEGRNDVDLNRLVLSLYDAIPIHKSKDFERIVNDVIRPLLFSRKEDWDQAELSSSSSSSSSISLSSSDASASDTSSLSASDSSSSTPRPLRAGEMALLLAEVIISHVVLTQTKDACSFAGDVLKEMVFDSSRVYFMLAVFKVLQSYAKPLIKKTKVPTDSLSKDRLKLLRWITTILTHRPSPSSPSSLTPQQVKVLTKLANIAIQLSDLIGTLGRGSERDAAASQIKALFSGCHEGVLVGGEEGGLVGQLLVGEGEEGVIAMSRLCALAVSSSPAWLNEEMKKKILEKGMNTLVNRNTPLAPFLVELFRDAVAKKGIEKDTYFPIILRNLKRSPEAVIQPLCLILSHSGWELAASDITNLFTPLFSMISSNSEHSREWAVKSITSLLLNSPPDSRKGGYSQLQAALGSKKSEQVHTRVALFNILENFLKVVEGGQEEGEEVKKGMGALMVGGLVGFIEKDPASEDLKLRAMELLGRWLATEPEKLKEKDVMTFYVNSCKDAKKSIRWRQSALASLLNVLRVEPKEIEKPNDITTALSAMAKSSVSSPKEAPFAPISFAVLFMLLRIKATEAAAKKGLLAAWKILTTGGYPPFFTNPSFYDKMGPIEGCTLADFFDVVVREVLFKNKTDTFPLVQAFYAIPIHLLNHRDTKVVSYTHKTLNTLLNHPKPDNDNKDEATIRSMLSRKFIEFQYSALCNAEGCTIEEDIYGEAPTLGPDMIVTRSMFDVVVSRKLDAYFAAPWGREGEKKEEEKGKGKQVKKEVVKEWDVDMKKYKGSRVFSSRRVGRALQAITLRSQANYLPGDKQEALSLLFLASHHPLSLPWRTGKGKRGKGLGAGHPWKKLCVRMGMETDAFFDIEGVTEGLREVLFGGEEKDGEKVREGKGCAMLLSAPSSQQAAANAVRTITSQNPEYASELLEPVLVPLLKDAAASFHNMKQEDLELFFGAKDIPAPPPPPSATPAPSAASSAPAGRGRGRGGASAGRGGAKGGRATTGGGRGRGASSERGGRGGARGGRGGAKGAEVKEEPSAEEETQKKLTSLAYLLSTSFSKCIAGGVVMEALFDAAHDFSYGAMRQLPEQFLSAILPPLLSLLSSPLSCAIVKGVVGLFVRNCVDGRVRGKGGVAEGVVLCCVGKMPEKKKEEPKKEEKKEEKKKAVKKGSSSRKAPPAKKPAPAPTPDPTPAPPPSPLLSLLSRPTISPSQFENLAGVANALKRECVPPIGSGPIVASTFALVFPVLKVLLLGEDVPLVAKLQCLSLIWLQCGNSLAGEKRSHEDVVGVLLEVLTNKLLYKACLLVLMGACGDVAVESFQTLVDGTKSSSKMKRRATLAALHKTPLFSSEWNREWIDSEIHQKILSHFFLLRHDTKCDNNAKMAEELYEKIGRPVLTWEYAKKFLLPLLSLEDEAVRRMAAKALASSMDCEGVEVKEGMEELKKLWEEKQAPPEKEGWEAFQDGDAPVDEVEKKEKARIRSGVGMAWAAMVSLIKQENRQEDSTRLLDYLFKDQTLADIDFEVRKEMLNAGIRLIRVHTSSVASTVTLPYLEIELNKPEPGQGGAAKGGKGGKAGKGKVVYQVSQKVMDDYYLMQEGAMILLVVSAVYLNPNDRRMSDVMNRVLSALKTSAQDSVADLLSELVRNLRNQEDFLKDYVKKLLDRLQNETNPDNRRGAALGIAGIVYGLGTPCLKKYGIWQTLQKLSSHKKSMSAKLGGMEGLRELARAMGRGFDPYAIQVIPHLLSGFGDASVDVRYATEETAKTLMSALPGPGIKMILPGVLKGLNDNNWKIKKGSVEMLGAMSSCAPASLSQCLPMIVPRLQVVVMDTHDQVCEAAKKALKEIGSVIVNPEILKQASALHDALINPDTLTEAALNGLLQTTFVHIIDPPSLALVVPVVERGLNERKTSTKKAACRLVGNMSRLAALKDLMPYLERLLTGLKRVLLDPIPEARETSAKALGKVLPSFGEESCPQVIPWLLETLVSDSGTVERSGAAQGLSEILAGLHLSKFEKMLPLLLRLSTDGQRPFSREGAMAMFCFLPGTLRNSYLPHLPQILPQILKGLADDAEGVRDQAMEAGQATITQFGREPQALDVLLPSLEKGLFNENWRIRQASVTLLGDLLEQIAAEVGADGSRLSQMEQGQAIKVALGVDRRNAILAALFMIRSDVNPTVRGKALLVWKTVAANSPKTLRQILPVIISSSIRAMSSDNLDKRQLAGKTIGSLVVKFGDEIINQVIPEIIKNETNPEVSIRLGAYLCLSTVVEHSSRQHTMAHLSGLVNSVKAGLIDDSNGVREAAANAFDFLVRKAGGNVVDQILPAMLQTLSAGGDEARRAMNGLRELIAVRGHMVLPVLIPSLTTPPVTPFKANAIATLSAVAGAALNPHLRDLLSPLASCILSATGVKVADEQDLECHTAVLKAAEAVVCAVEEESIFLLIHEFTEHIKPTADVPELIGWLKMLKLFVENNTIEDLEEQYQTILPLVMDLINVVDKEVLAAFAECLKSTVKAIPKEQMVEHVSGVKNSVIKAKEEIKKRKDLYVSGTSIPGVIRTILPVLTEGLLHGSSDTRYDAAKCMGDLVNLTDPSKLAMADIRLMAGPLIRVAGNRFAWHVREAVLSTLVTLLSCCGDLVKGFAPQLQTSFQKGLRDEARAVRLVSAMGLSKLMPYSKKVDSVLGDILNGIEEVVNEYEPTNEQMEIAEAMLKSLQGIFSKVGGTMNHSTLVSCGSRLKSVLMTLERERNPKPQTIVLIENATLALGVQASFLENDEEEGDGFFAYVQMANEDKSKDSSPSVRHSRCLLTCSLLRFCGNRLQYAQATIVKNLVGYLGDSNVPVCISAMKATTFLFKNVISPGSGDSAFADAANALFSPLSTLFTHPEYDIKLTSLMSLQGIARAHRSFQAFQPYLKLFLVPLVEIASSPRGYAQIRAEAEKGVVLLMAEKRNDPKLKELLIQNSLQQFAGPVQTYCRGKNAQNVDEEEVEDDFFSKI